MRERQSLACYTERNRAYRPEEYCFGRDDASRWNDNDLGCRHCGIDLYRQGLAGYGSMSRAGVFTVDKDKLLFEVRRNLEDWELCPALDIDAVLARLKEIPDQISPSRNKDWEYVTDWSEGQPVAVGVRKKHPSLKQGYALPTSETMEIRLNLDDVAPAKEKPSQTSRSSGAGCIWAIVIFIGLILLLAML